MIFNEARLVSLATQMGLNPLEAVSLPLAVEIAARKTGMTEGAFIDAMQRCSELRDYVRQACTAGSATLVGG